MRFCAHAPRNNRVSDVTSETASESPNRSVFRISPASMSAVMDEINLVQAGRIVFLNECPCCVLCGEKVYQEFSFVCELHSAQVCNLHVHAKSSNQ